MKPTPFFLISIVLLFISSCNHTNEPTSIPLKVDQLKTVVAPDIEDNDLVPYDGTTFIINSIADVYDTQTEKFIEENPEWLAVDFTTKSIIAQRGVLVAYNYWQSINVIEFSQYTVGDEILMWKKGDYKLVLEDNYAPHDPSENHDMSQYRIFQIAFVTEKIPSDAKIMIHHNGSLFI